MRKSLASMVLGLGLVGAASAQSYGYSDGYQHNDHRYNQARQADPCVKQRKDGQTGGAIVGGLLGALAGGAIGNNIDGDDRRYRRGYRGYGHGYRGFRRGNNSNSGKVAAGAIIGGLVGAVAGSQVGKNNVKCNSYHDSANTRGYRGDPSIAPPTRQPWPSSQTRSYPVSQPTTVYRTTQPTTSTRTVRTYPAPTQTTRVYRNDDLYGGREQCEMLTRVTRLPDGREIREQVQDCDQGDVWYEKNGQRVQGGY